MKYHAWYGDQGAHYSYSGISLPINEWSPQLSKLKARVEEKVGVTFNGVLCNLYESGLHSNGWHSDDEKELLRPITVASVSLGEQRTFQLRRKGQTRIEARVELESGSLFIMKAPFQEKWQHQIAKSKKVLGKRLNLTFRKVDVSLG
jgi:alkylated DNA repair dioxygenase AlkB